MTAVLSLTREARRFNRAILQAFAKARACKPRDLDTRNYWIGECRYARYQRDVCMTMARKLRSTGRAF